MQRIIMLICILVSCVSAGSCFPGYGLYSEISDGTSYGLIPERGCFTSIRPYGAFAQEIFDAINYERTSRGLAALNPDSRLARIACLRSQDMAQKHYFGHVSPTGETVFTLMERFGIPYAYAWAGENTAFNSYPADQTVTVAIHNWMASKGHRDNILLIYYTNVGVGVATDGMGIYYYTVVFLGPSQ